jgi:cold shock protein
MSFTLPAAGYTYSALAVSALAVGRFSNRPRQREAVRSGKEVHRMSGTIKKLVADRGFGFITADDGTDYFFHRSGSLEFDRLETGVKVSFVTEPSPKGPRATNVRLAA